MVHQNPEFTKVRVEMSLEPMQRDAQHRALLRQAGIEPQGGLGQPLRRLLVSAGSVMVALGGRLERLGALRSGSSLGSLPSSG